MPFAYTWIIYAAHDSYHVVAIDFSPHTESMQTDALLATGMRSAGVNLACFDSGSKNLFVCVGILLLPVIMFILIFTL